jgi:hypothetical protein
MFCFCAPNGGAMDGQFEAPRASPRLSHAEAIAAVLDSPHCPVEVIAELLAELKASGDYDRIIAEGAQLHQDVTT